MDDPTDTSNTYLPKRIAQTLIFLDLESTGLPFLVGKKNVQITELSLIAVDRTEFENSDNVRIVNKLSLTIQPRSNISFEAIHMTGLCNTSLQFQEYFSPTTAQLLQLFFQRLNQPVCLLAHNGRRFDFPVLQAELKNVGATLDDSIYCADTIDAFREILSKQNSVEINVPVSNISVAMPTCHHQKTSHDTDRLNENIHQTFVKNEALYTNTLIKSCVQYYEVNALTNENIDQLLDQEMEIFENLKSKDECQSLPLDMSFHSISKNQNQEILNLNARGENITSLFVDDLLVPLNSQQLNEKTPLNKVTSTPVISNRYKDSAYEPIASNNNKKDHSSVRKKLFKCKDSVADNQPPISNKKNKMSFSLKNLYHYFFKSDMPSAHFAEADCMSLMKISRELKEFLPWVDEHMILFNNVRPLW